MGLFNRIFRDIPGNPVRLASLKSCLRSTTALLQAMLTVEKKEVLRYTLETRYQILKMMKQYEWGC